MGASMRIFLRPLLSLLLGVMCTIAFAQSSPPKPGLQQYIPNRIQWLALICNDQLRQDRTTDNHFSLSVVQFDHETLLIFVNYHPGVNREIMNARIDTAREVIMITAKSYGWDKWVQIKERVEMRKLNSERTQN